MARHRTNPAPPRARPADLDTDALATEIDRRIRTLPRQTIQPIRSVRHADSKRLRAARAEVVAALAVALVDRQRWVASELVSTVPLDLRSRGGAGGTRRTLDICQRLVADHEMLAARPAGGPRQAGDRPQERIRQSSA